MKIQKVGTRGFLFSFDDPYFTNIYVINGDNYLFIIDTFLGPEPMMEAFELLQKEDIKDKKIVVFNTHYDYDHIWGNQLFENTTIISHALCKQILEESGEEDLKKYESHKKGDVRLVLPNTIFTDKYLYPEEGVEFYHSPGHTEDSSSCFDSIDKVLIVGDNLESPFPYIRIMNIPDYISSLKEYLTRDAAIIISGHDELMNNDSLLRANLEYLENFGPGKIDRSKFTKKHRGIHFQNIKTVAELLKKEGKNDEALDYYLECLAVIEEAEQTPQIDELRGEIWKIVEELS